MSTPDVLRKALADLKPHAAGPLPKDHFQAISWEMAGAHACLMNGLLSLYEVRPSSDDCVHDTATSGPINSAN